MESLDLRFSLKDLGKLSYFLGIEVTHSFGALSQSTPDITFAVNRVCQFMHKPLDFHFKSVKHASCANDPVDRRSTLGFCIFLCGNPVSLGSKKQHVVSRSSAEEEYRSLAHAAVEVT
ncbi:hypothetical protein CXB51_008294 [Gossypium anomalum]|uniref:Reverse transcriptase Ty1/copia-type domain-containing protein n=1 Tax=Gossypium anomalum TaxID=47600 RepID=A0A8J5Z907_9ROSI|nr:hypothetical protein CXB51_008294 [Gossypium anomalum]